jgi:hypothetical protein
MEWIVSRLPGLDARIRSRRKQIVVVPQVCRRSCQRAAIFSAATSISDNVLYRRVPLASRGAHRHAFGMFIITEADAAAILAVFDQEGELSAAIELRRRFPGVTDNAKARACARRIAGWTPLQAQPRAVTRLRPGKDT